MSTDETYNRCVRRIHQKNGRFMIECRLGLWCVEGADPAVVEREASHYWVQYHADGEYDKLLAEPEGKKK